PGGDLLIVWASPAAANRLGLAAALPCRLDAVLAPAGYTRAAAAAREAIASGRTIDTDLPSCAAAVIPVGQGPTHPPRVVIEFAPVAAPASAAELARALELARDNELRFNLLFSQNIDGVFFMELDQPVRWDGEADKEALIDYAFEHCRISALNNAMCEQL